MDVSCWITSCISQRQTNEGKRQLTANLYLGTWNEGVYRSSTPTVGISHEQRLHLARFSLAQNYPNPFNPTTTIGYTLPQRAHVTLAVFNTLGQRVATLVSGEVEAGYHEAQFNASGLASGVYFYRFIVERFLQTRSMLLIR